MSWRMTDGNGREDGQSYFTLEPQQPSGIIVDVL
jgi:hypothetical protein